MAEDRHRIEQNELAIWLGKLLGWLRPYARPLAWGATIVVVVVLVGAIWRSSSGAAAARASEALAQALAQRSPGALEDVARQHGGTVGQLAQLAAADLYFSEGTQQLFINKTIARQDLQKALELYRQVESSARNPEIHARAIFGVARTLEAMSGTEAGQGLLREAVAKYRELVQKFPTDPFAFFAQQRLADLELEDTKRFYDRFAKYDPRPPLQPEAPVSTPLPETGLNPPSEPTAQQGQPAPAGESSAVSTVPLPPLVSPGEVSPKSEEKPGEAPTQPSPSPNSQQGPQPSQADSPANPPTASSQPQEP